MPSHINHYRRWRAIGASLLILTALPFGLTACGSDDDGKSSSSTSKSSGGDGKINGWSKADAKDACHDKVKSQLVSPSTAKFEGWTETKYLQNDAKTKWTLTGHVDSENSFGGTVRKEWSCTVVPTDKDHASVQAVLL